MEKNVDAIIAENNERAKEILANNVITTSVPPSYLEKQIDDKIQSVNLLDSSKLIFFPEISYMISRGGIINLKFGSGSNITTVGNAIIITSPNNYQYNFIIGSPMYLTATAFMHKDIYNDTSFNGGYINFTFSKDNVKKYSNIEYLKNEMIQSGDYYRISKGLNLKDLYEFDDQVLIEDISLYINYNISTVLVRSFRSTTV